MQVNVEILSVKDCFFSLKFVSLSDDAITSSHIIAEPFIILAKYFRFWKLHVEGFQI